MQQLLPVEEHKKKNCTFITRFLGFGPLFFGPCNSLSRSLKKKKKVVTVRMAMTTNEKTHATKRTREREQIEWLKGDDRHESCGWAWAKRASLQPCQNTVRFPLKKKKKSYSLLLFSSGIMLKKDRKCKSQRREEWHVAKTPFQSFVVSPASH